MHSNVSSITTGTGGSQQDAGQTPALNNNASQTNDTATQVTNGSRQGGAGGRG